MKRLMFALFMCTGCSFVSSRPPPSAPEERTAKTAAKCGDVWYPLADMLSSFAGFTWVLYADQKEDESRPKMLTNGPTGYTMVDAGPPTQSYQTERIFGYGAMGVFGASSIYGFIVEMQCGNLRREIKEHQARRSEDLAPVRADLPSSVSGFTFDMRQEQAERACMEKRQEWQLEGTVAHCRPKLDAPAAQPVRLEFESGTLTRIVVLYGPLAEGLNKNYDQIYATLRGTYGAPQLDRDPLVGECGTALAECMKKGQKIKASVWHWPSGSIELQPVWQGDQTLLEVRYSHEDPATQ